MPGTYETLSGHTIPYPDFEPAVTRFLTRVMKALGDQRVTEDDLVLLIYGTENPILDRTLFPERGMVTKEVLEHPAYPIMCDALARKRAAIKGQTAEQLGRPFTLTVAQAAKQCGVSEDAINRGIRARRIPSWVKDGQRYLDPRTFAALGLGERGALPEGFMRLRVKVGASHTAQVRVKHAGGELPSKAEAIPYAIETTLPRSQRVAVLMAGANGTLRMFELIPGEEETRLPFEEFLVQGNFEIARKVNGARAARLAWESFEAS